MSSRPSVRAKILVVLAALLALALVRALLGRKGSGSGARPKPTLVMPVWTGRNPSPPLLARSPGCDRPGATTGPQVRTLQVAGHERTYLMAVPATHGAKPLPVVFRFHHAKPTIRGGLPPVEVMLKALDAPEAVETGAILVAPQGTPFPADRTIGWYAHCPGDDVTFFDAMLAAIGDSHCIDPRAVLVSGFSWGAEMAMALACCRGERIRVVAPASGVNLAGMQRCPAGKLPALFAAYAENDPFYDLRELSLSVAFFRQTQRCAGAADPVEPPPCVAYRGCAQPVIECRYRSIGHDLPPGFTENSWAFFRGLIARDPPASALP
jgi:polyhydroxybutyrate depolymerase